MIDIKQTSSSSSDNIRDFAALMKAVREGSQDAAWEILESYGPTIRRVVRRTLHASLRSKFDSVDFIQSLWLSFFLNRAKVVDFHHPEQLVAYLTTIARNKVITEIRKRLYTEKHNVRREQPMGAQSGLELASNEPTPSDFAIARERWNQLLAGQPDHYQSIVRLKYAGETNCNIAASLGINEKTVRRVLEKLKISAAHD